MTRLALALLLTACAGEPRAAAPSAEPASRAEPSTTAQPSTPPTSNDEQDLQVHEVGEGLPVVVLLHGYGARGDDLVPLGRRLQAQTGGRYLMPEAVFPMSNGGRRWFGRREVGFGPSEVQRSREAVERLLAKIESQGIPRSKIVLGGFSQGAMLTTDVALNAAAESEPLGGLLILSGSIMNTWDLESDRLRGVPVLVAHGRRDPILPFEDAHRLSEALEAQGAELNWLPFDGEHTIPSEAIDAVRVLVATVGQ